LAQHIEEAQTPDKPAGSLYRGWMVVPALGGFVIDLIIAGSA
jgi:hypothetical protein